MTRVRLIADPSAANSVGIPREGEMFDAEDAERLIGMGICQRKPANRKRKRKTEAPAPPPATEG